MSEGTTLGKAWVQIVPSAKGIAGSISSLLGGEAQSAGISAGTSFGNSMVDAIKGVIASAASGLGAAASAAIAFGTDAVQVGQSFDAAMSQVAATMGYSVAELNKEGSEASETFSQLRDFAQDMGAKTAFSASQAADALNFMALAGYDAKTSVNMLPNVLRVYPKIS